MAALFLIWLTLNLFIKLFHQELEVATQRLKMYWVIMINFKKLQLWNSTFHISWGQYTQSISSIMVIVLLNYWGNSVIIFTPLLNVGRLFDLTDLLHGCWLPSRPFPLGHDALTHSRGASEADLHAVWINAYRTEQKTYCLCKARWALLSARCPFNSIYPNPLTLRVFVHQSFRHIYFLCLAYEAILLYRPLDCRTYRIA